MHDRFFRFFKLKNQRFDLILGQTYKGEYNYKHPAIIVRPVIQSLMIVTYSGCLPVLFYLTNSHSEPQTVPTLYI